MTTEGGDAAPGARRGFRWVRAASDRVPTRWFAGIATGFFLAMTAAFGGLATATQPALRAIQPGEEHRNDQLSITVDRAVLLDEFPEAGIFVEDDERVLAVRIGVENQWTEALSADPRSSIAESLEVTGLSAPSSVARYDDATVNPWLQPGVPAELVITWAVDADQFADGDQLHVTLSDLSLYTASFVTTGQSWEDPVPAATLTLAVEDVGAGG